MLRKSRGFTIIELMIVIVIVAIAIAFAGPQIMKLTERQNQESLKNPPAIEQPVVEDQKKEGLPRLKIE
jgi:prepilin-type N-terminal cleavage/methylation domain-containing protein